MRPFDAAQYPTHGIQKTLGLVDTTLQQLHADIKLA